MKRQPFEEGWDAGMRGYKNPELICRYEKHTKGRYCISRTLTNLNGAYNDSSV